MDDLLRPRQAAQRILRWWHESQSNEAPAEAPQATGVAVATPVDQIVARLGLEVAPFHPETRRGGTLGWLEPGEDVIFLREDLAEPIRRFTLAHELGHAVLHRAAPPAPLVTVLEMDASVAGEAIGHSEEPETDTDALNALADPCDTIDLDAPLDPLSLSDEALRPGQSYSARARRESEANAFAAALLLPPTVVRALFLGDEARPGLPPRLLAERLGVSEDAVHQALSGLLPAGLADDELEGAPGGRLGSSSMRPRLDDWQRAAAAAPAPALVVAGPGTGKTSTLAGRVAHLVFEQGVDPRQILALTFSNKAAQEMRERLTALLGAPPEDASLSANYAPPTVSTIHAFCGELLRRYGPLVGLSPDFRLISETEGYLLLRELVPDLALSFYQPLANPAFHFPALLAAISRAKDELVGPARYQALGQQMAARAQTPEEQARASHAREVARIYAAYQDALAQRGDADFGDLIVLAVRLLRENEEVLTELRGRYAHVLVDEFQDINHAMGELLRTLAGADGPIWAVGDADQAIYRFRGAAPANLARFTELYPRARVLPLGTNYRSHPEILRAAAAVAGALLGAGERRVLAAAWQPADAATEGAAHGGTEAGAVADVTITLASAPDDEAELAGLAASITANTARGYMLADQAVLCRTRRQSQRVAAALAAAGLPARIVRPLLDQPDVKDILSVILLLADSSGAGLLRAGNVPDHPFTRAEARAVIETGRVRHTIPLDLLLDAGSPLAEVEELTPAGISGLARLGEVLNDLWSAPDVATGLARYVFALTGVARRALADASAAGRARAGDLARLLMLARAFERQRPDAQPNWYRPQVGAARWVEFVDYLRVLTALGREPGGAADDPLTLESDGVRVLTVHGSKGLEFPIVYLPGLADGRFPTQRRGDAAPPPLGLSAEARDGTEHLVEEACLFYVALTRARDALVISHAERYGRRRYAPSPFLKPLLRLAEDPAAGITRVRWAGTPTTTEHGQQAGHSHTVEPLSALADEDGAASGRAPEPEPRPAAGPLRPAAIETYQRCPRQFAYRYVYQLRPREVGLGTLRRGLHETLRELQDRFAVEGAAERAEETKGPEAHQPPSLEEARLLFHDHWRAAVASEARAAHDAAGRTDRADRESAHGSPLEGPFGALYRRHGLRVVERAWLDLMRQRGLAVPQLADAAGGGEALPAGRVDGQREAPALDDAPDTLDPAGAEHAAAPVPLGARLEERVVLRVNGREIELTLDRVEGERLAEREAGRPARPALADVVTAREPREPADALATPVPAPVRFVRHRLGGGSRPSPADLRALLYALAAEQEHQPTAPELFQHNLTTGELERVRIDPRRRERLRDELTRVLAGMESGVYPAKPEPAMCAGCPFLLVCPG